MKIASYSKLIAGCTALLLSGSLYAQQNKPADKPVETRVVEVTREFKGEITDADRIKMQIRPSDSASVFKSSFDYKINPMHLPLFSTVRELEAAAIEEKVEQVENFGYARFGLGAPLSVLGDLYLHYRFSPKTMGNFYLNHRSYWDNTRLFTEQPQGVTLPDNILNHNAQTDFGLSFQHHFEKLTLHASVDYKNRYLLFHGHDTAYLTYLNSNYPQYISDINNNSSNLKDMLGQHYNILNANAGVVSNNAKDEIGYNANLFFGYAHGSVYSVNEYIGGLNGKVLIPFNDVHSFNMGLGAMFYNKGNASRLSDGMFCLLPEYSYQSDMISLHAGLNLEGVYASYNESAKRDSGKLSMHIYPNILFTAKLLNNLSAYVNMTGGTAINTYQKTALENPYILPELALDNTRTAFEIMAGVRGRVFNNVGYNIFGSFANIKNHYFYVNSTEPLPTTATYTADGYLRNNFDVTYYDTKRWTLGADVSYTAGDFKSELHGRYNHYSFNDTLAGAWHKPTWELSCDLQYKYEAFNFQLGFGMHGRAPYLYNNPTIENEVRHLNIKFDLSAQVEYQINKWFTAFVYGKNLINQKYQNYYLYYNPGITGGVGVTVRF